MICSYSSIVIRVSTEQIGESPQGAGVALQSGDGHRSPHTSSP